MSAVASISVEPRENEIRLDRWFKRHFPTLPHGRLERLLRTGQIRVDGKRAKASLRLVSGQVVRVPPLDEAVASALQRPRTAPNRARDEHMAAVLRRRVLFRDRDALVIDKPAGLAVQGGTATDVHLDGLLDALRFDASERPRLVHRLDKDTSGVLVLARSATAAAGLAEAFRRKEARKIPSHHRKSIIPLAPLTPAPGLVRVVSGGDAPGQLPQASDGDLRVLDPPEQVLERDEAPDH